MHTICCFIARPFRSTSSQYANERTRDKTLLFITHYCTQLKCINNRWRPLRTVNVGSISCCNAHMYRSHVDAVSGIPCPSRLPIAKVISHCLHQTSLGEFLHGSKSARNLIISPINLDGVLLFIWQTKTIMNCGFIKTFEIIWNLANPLIHRKSSAVHFSIKTTYHWFLTLGTFQTIRLRRAN